MKRLIVLIMVFLMAVVMMSSCSFLRGNLAKLADEHIQTAIEMREISDKLKSCWDFYSGTLDGMSDVLSGEIMNLKTRLDELYGSENWDDHAAGEALALRTRLIKEIGQDLIKEALPGFLDLF